MAPAPINNLQIYNKEPARRQLTATYKEPEELLEGMGEYFVLSSKIKNEIGESPDKRKEGWKVITKAIFNPQAPQHKIFKENLSHMT